MKKNFIIAVDFDGTCTTHEFPKIGEDIGAVPVLKKIVEAGHKIILFTMRSDSKEVVSEDPEIHQVAKPYLTEAVEWFMRNKIPLFGINVNPNQKSWTSSPKPYAHIYIDDANIFIPLIYSKLSIRPYVDWGKIEKELIKLKLI